ncbi:hypothetical protein STEG23_016048, partial [Scotinomys teguina]
EDVISQLLTPVTCYNDSLVVVNSPSGTASVAPIPKPDKNPRTTRRKLWDKLPDEHKLEIDIKILNIIFTRYLRLKTAYIKLYPVRNTLYTLSIRGPVASEEVLHLFYLFVIVIVINVDCLKEGDYLHDVGRVEHVVLDDYFMCSFLGNDDSEELSIRLKGNHQMLLK